MAYRIEESSGQGERRAYAVVACGDDDEGAMSGEAVVAEIVAIFRARTRTGDGAPSGVEAG